MGVEAQGPAAGQRVLELGVEVVDQNVIWQQLITAGLA